MSKLNLQVYLNAYSDSNSSNNPSQNNFKWLRDMNGLIVSDPQSIPVSLAPGETKSIFNAARSLSQDGSTQYSIALKPLVSNTYVLSWVSGTAPNFRTPRSTGADATTQVSVTLNGPLATFTSTGGTAFDFSSVQIGDQVVIGDEFNPGNQGIWTIIAKTSTSITVENELGFAEGPITLGSDFANQVQVFSAAGVQAGDTLNIVAGFSQATWGSYAITAVHANSLEFISVPVLPVESAITTQVAIYESAKKFVYLETDQPISMIVNGVENAEVRPFVINSSTSPGLFMRTDTIFSLSVTNDSLSPANIFLAFVG
jgi:hypothetical protein